ncbi:MAG TPA: CopD family protein [Kofleriaceae bacterium]|nr:CopD family protein [Kofleriaceae bacterium]
MFAWLQVGHLIGTFLWIGGLFTVYWLLRFHVHAPKEVHEKLTLIERAVALSMELAATLAIVCGVIMIFDRPGPNLFAAPGAGWFHIKLAVVVLGVLSVHGLLRARIKKLSVGKQTTVPQWIWSLLLVSLTVIVIMVRRGPIMFAPKVEPAKTPTTAPVGSLGSAATPNP